MAEPFKLLLNADVVGQASLHLHRAWRQFPQAKFEAMALAGLEDLEFKARAEHIRAALEATLPTPFAQAADVIEASLAPARLDDDLSALKVGDQGLAGWIVWSLGDYVARQGQGDVPRALRCLHALTQRFSAEFAIRPFIVAHQAQVLDTLGRWLDDPSPHVRRLISEGTRPRLPWGLRLQALVQDPSPCLPLLKALQDDPSEYVRRSVANHLNDIAKDHPSVVVDWVQHHRDASHPHREALLRHASRGLVKAGHAPMLRAWGVGQSFQGEASWTLAPKRVALGEHLTLTLTLASQSRKAQRLEIDYTVHHLNARGTHNAKVFKGWRLSLDAGQSLVLSKRHPMRVVTTRRYVLGTQRVEITINGKSAGLRDFTLASA